jgi:hypothetical protein
MFTERAGCIYSEPSVDAYAMEMVVAGKGTKLHSFHIS